MVVVEGITGCLDLFLQVLSRPHTTCSGAVLTGCLGGPATPTHCCMGLALGACSYRLSWRSCHAHTLLHGTRLSWWSCHAHTLLHGTRLSWWSCHAHTLLHGTCHGACMSLHRPSHSDHMHNRREM